MQADTENPAKDAPALAGLIAAISEPLVTSGDQPPAPGSSWIVRGWHSLRRLGGRAIDVLPKKTTTLALILRLVLVVAVWLLIAFVALEVLTFWVFIVYPVQLLAKRRRARRTNPPDGGVARPPPPPPASYAWPQQPAVLTPDIGLARLATAPDPDPEPANDECPMCGGSTAGAKSACLFCGSPLPMVAKRGWHRDPLGLGDRRWFDGTAWTEFTSIPD